MSIINRELKEKYTVNNNIDYQKVINKIAYKLSLEEQKIILPVSKINSNKIIIISDTHFGSTYDNYSYLDTVYNYAINNNITDILHGGDLTQGTPKPVNKNCIDLCKQVKNVIDFYPYDKNIKNYILLGNHDNNIYNNKNNILTMFDERKDLELLGIVKIYLNWYNYLISISHYIKNHNLDILRIEPLINFAGHRHDLKIKDNTLFLPTLSDDLKYYGNNENYPAFLHAEIIDNKLFIYKYDFINSKEVNKKLVLEKDTNERVRL